MTTQETQPTEPIKASDQSVVTGVPMWFAIDSCGDIETFDDPRAAKKAADDALDMERDAAAEGWNEGVTNIMWGQVRGQVKETSCRERTDEDTHVSPDCGFVVEYDVLPVEDTEGDFAAITDAIGCVRQRRTIAGERGDTEMASRLTSVIETLRKIRRASR